MTKTKILVADDLGEEGMALLRDAGDVTVKTGMDEATLRETLPGFEVLVVRSATKVTRKSLELADDLALIGRAGIGVDNIDVPAATDRGIAVMNTPNVEVVAGINLPMLVKLAKVRGDTPLTQAVAHAQDAGRKYINIASRVLAGTGK